MDSSPIHSAVPSPSRWRLAAETNESWWQQKWGWLDTLLGLLAAITLSTIFSIPFLVIAAAQNTEALLSGDSRVILNTLLTGPVIISSLVGLWLGFIGSAWIATRFRGQRSLRLDFGFAWPTTSDIRWGILLGLGCLLISIGFPAALSAVGVDMTDAQNSSFLLNKTLLWTIVLGSVAAIGAPIVEELFFRGLMLRSILKISWVRRLSPEAAGVVAIGASSIIFGALHIPALSVGGVALGMLTGLLGLILATVTILSGRLPIAIVAHVVINTVGVVTTIALGESL